MVTQIYKIWSEIWVDTFPQNLVAPKHQNFGVTWLRISPECNTTLSIGKRRCKLWTLLHRQTSKNKTRVLTHPSGGLLAGSCHASIIVTDMLWGRSIMKNINLFVIAIWHCAMICHQVCALVFNSPGGTTIRNMYWVSRDLTMVANYRLWKRWKPQNAVIPVLFINIL